MSDFFAEEVPSRPVVRAEEVSAFLSERYGITARIRELGSHQDRNYLVTPDAPHASRYLFKVDNPMFDDAELAAQDEAQRTLADLGLTVPVPVAGLDGQVAQEIVVAGGRYRSRLLTFVEGVPLADGGAPEHEALEALGRLSARVNSGLACLSHRGLERNLQWDLRNAIVVIESLAKYVADEALRAEILSAGRKAWSCVEAVAADLPLQAIHGDVTGDNVVGSWFDDKLQPSAVIDFGDLGNGWRVAELAVTVAGAFSLRGGDVMAALPTISGFVDVVSLSAAERDALWPLVVLRGAVLVVSGHYQAALEGDNEYVRERLDEERAAFAAATSISLATGVALVERLIDGAHREHASDLYIPMVDMSDAPPRVVDLRPSSSVLDDGKWLNGSETEQALLLEAVGSSHTAVIPHGMPRLTASSTLLAQPPSVSSVGTELGVRAGVAIVAPAESQVVEIGARRVRLRLMEGGASTEVIVDGVVPTVAAGDCLAPGQRLARASSPDGEDMIARLRITWVTVAGWEPQPLVPAAWRSVLKKVVRDPAVLIGIRPFEDGPSPAVEQQRRDALFASAQERYFVRPPSMERGWRNVLIDSDARCYLDMVNNVTGIGHSHPHLTSLVAAQLSVLNTNSRFLYPRLAEFSERLIALAPDPSLDTVLLVNSGTEAVDLALKLARAHTRRKDVVALREGYHGWSYAADAVSTSAYDNPDAMQSRPDWVHIADVPNPYRGTHRGPDAGARYLADLKADLGSLVKAGHPPAAYIAEPVLGNAGGVVPPSGYVAGAYDLAREVGALCISDEVQVGYGRLGSHFWGSDSQGAVPDIIATAKAMGNAFPLGAVITRREIADSLSAEGNFFSSAGGAPVSCAAGIAVLDVMQREELQESAHAVGQWLKDALTALMDQHSIIGAVHGFGLYLGVELVRDRTTLEPAAAETAALCELMLTRGVIVQATSERQNVIKVKPPLTLTKMEAEFFVAQLDDSLRRLQSYFGTANVLVG